MGSTTAVFILFILFGLSYQQDAVESGGVTCPENVNGLNGACLTSYPVDPSNSDFCSNAFALSQCLDASCLDTKYRDAIHTFVPPLFRPGSCPICSTVPTEVSESRKTCTVWGIYHTIDFNSNVVLCPQQNSTILLTNEYFTITALTNTTVDERLTSGILYPGITGIRFDYHGCAVYSRTWLSKDDWDARRIPAQGWFPHLITITQNTTEAVVNLLAVNTDLIIRKTGRYMSISIRTGLADVSEGICTTQNSTCAAETLIFGYPTAVAYTTCSKLPDQFQLACQYDLDSSNNTSNLGLSSLDASISFARINALSDLDNFGTINAREVAVPVVLTVVSTGLMIIIFFLALLVKCRRNQRRPSDAKTVLFFIGWIFLVLNTHVLGFVYPFTGLMFISVAFNIACLIAIWLLSNDILGNSLAPIQRSYKAFTIISLPQQFCIGVIGAAANEWYLWEVQFWWGIAVLVFLLFAGSFLAVTVLGLIWKSPEKPPKERPRKENRYVPEVELEAQVPEEVRVNQMQDRARASSVSSSGSSSSYSTKKPVETKPEPSHVINADPHVIVQPSHVVEPSHVISPPAQPNIYNNHVIDINPQPQHVVQPSHVIVPQEHVIQPQTQSHVIEPQPMYYGNATDAPPPPKDGGAFASPSPLDVYQNPGKYMSDQESSSDPARHMLKRAIKLAGVDVDGAKEAQIYAKMMELLQTYNLTGVVSRDDGEAATLRNNLATDLSEEIKLYQNDSLDELSYGLKEAILLWKEDNHL